MRYHLRVPEDQPTRKEFDVIPASGTILPHGKQKIQVDFLSNTVQEYNAHLVVDIDEVGDNLDSLPIKATCIVPEVAVSRDQMDYGQCFIGYPYMLEVDLRNDTALSAKYEFILPAEDDPIRKKADLVIGSGDLKERKGIVQARSSTKIQVTLTAKMTGAIHLPLFVRVLGSDRVPHHIAVSAKVTGPKIEVMPKVLEFGAIDVLTDVSKPIVIANNSPIPAHFTAKLLAKHPQNVLPPFTLRVADGVIKPNSTAPLHILAHLDEAMKFSDELVISVQHNNEVEQVQLTATGRGYTIVPSIPIELVDFGDLFTTVPVKRIFTLYNKGRKPQQIQWQNERGKQKEGDPPIVFQINPERATINGKSEETFTIEGISNNKGLFMEKFVCKMSQSHKTIFKASLQGNFQPPLLQYSANSLQFAYTYNPDEHHTGFISSKPLTMKNVSPLDLVFSIKILKATGSIGTTEYFPFTVDQSDFSLKRGESAAVTVCFDAAYRGDRVSHKTAAKIIVSFANHGQKDTVNLVGEVTYPNLTMDMQSVDFGCILNDTEQRRILTISNSSSVPATYTWVFEDDNVNRVEGTSKKSAKNAAQDGASVPVNNIFDVIPFRGVIAPGATEKAEILFNGVPGKKFSAVAVCQVEGGPDYPVQFLGEASSINYKLDRVALDFGTQEYDQWEEREINITNNGRVPFTFQADLSCMSRPGMVEVIPMSGTVKDKARVVVRFSPRVPDRVDDNFKIQIAHFEPQLINVRGAGLYSSIAVVATGNFVSRDDPPVFKNYLGEARMRVTDPSFRMYSAVPPKGAEVVDPILAEAERMYFRDIITEDALMIKAIAAGEATENQERSMQIKRKTFTGDQMKYILSRYIVDMGNIVKGDSRRKTIKISNTSTNAISFAVDRKALAASGLVSLNPDKFGKLPAFAQQSIDVTINTKAKPVTGHVSQEIIVDIKGGPLVLLEVRAFIVIPQLEVSQESLDFGEVFVGMTRIIPISIENTQALPCEWAALYPDAVDPNKKKASAEKHGKFVCKPEKGVLQPGQKTVVQVSFIPLLKEELKQRIQLRITANPKLIELFCSGIANELELAINPPIVEMPPVFPFQPARQTFQLVNKSAVPLEVFCLNFDERYLVEEDILRNAQEFFEDDVLLLPPREVGTALPDHLMEAYFNKLLSDDNQFAAVELVPTTDDVNVPLVELEKPPVVQPSVPLPPLESTQAAGGEPEQQKPFIVVLTGPPLSGKTTCAGFLQRRGLGLLNINACIANAMQIDSPEGAYFRGVCHAFHTAPVSARARSDPSFTTALTQVIKQRIKLPPFGQGVVIDDISCSLSLSPEAVLQALKDVAAASQTQIYFVSLGLSEANANLRKAVVSQSAAQQELDRTAISPLSEIEYEKLDESSRKMHDLQLKRFRDCKRTLQKVTEEVELLRKEYERQLDAKKLITIQEEVDKEVTEAKEAEEVNAKGKKAPPPKKGGPVAAADTTQVVNWESLTPIPYFKRLYKILVEDPSHRLVLAEGPVDDMQQKLKDVLPPLPVISGSSDGDRKNAAAVSHELVTLPPPSTMQRIEKQLDKRTLAQVRYFKILTSVLRDAISPAGGGGKDPKKAAPPPKGATALSPAQQVETMEELSRWIIQPGSTIDLTVHFCCDVADTHETTLSMGVVGSTVEFPLQCKITSAYPEILRDPKVMFQKKIRAQPEGRLSNKSYVLTKKAYEFGPLLVPAVVTAAPSSKKAEPKKGGPSPQAAPSADPMLSPRLNMNNNDKIKFTNCGMFPAEVFLMFESDKERTFTIQPDTFTLQLGESLDVTMTALPDTTGEMKNVLVVCVKDNPEPLRVDVTCLGARPEVTIDNKKDLLVDFGRMLLRRSECKKITVKNECALPVRWKVTGLEKLPQEISLDVTSGVLDVGISAQIAVTFQSERATTFNLPLKIEVSDLDGTAVYESLSFTVKAEAHDVVLEWTKELDYKTIRVGEPKKEVIKILNKGPYEVSYSFRLPKKLQDLITITPAEGTLRGMQGFKDAAIVNVEAVFKADQREVQINSKKFGDIELLFIDPVAKELVYPIQQIGVKGEALYNKFQIKPNHINFGPCLFRQKKQATFDVQNTGCFEIKYKLYSFKDGVAKLLEAPVEPVVAAGKKPPAKPGKKDNKADDVLDFQLGAFTVSPAVGVIAVGSTTTFTVSINPEGNAHFSEVLGVYIEDRDPAANKEGIPFELEAESCIPGIIADLDLPEADSIFEEQQIVSRLDQFRKVAGVFAREDRIFSFGTGLSGRRLSERFRITNPIKVPCTVSLQIVPRGDAPDAKLATESFDIQNSKQDGGKLVIPPHEHRYVTVGFTPNSLNTFSAVFEATVEGGSNPKTRQLRFELRGEGSLPNLAVDIPPPPLKAQDTQVVEVAKVAKGKAAAPSKAEKQKEEERPSAPNTLVMPRTIVGTSCSRSITVRNIGELPATIRFSCPASQNKCFSFPSRNEELVLAPGVVEKYSVYFEPKSIGEHSGKVTMSVQDNHYEDTIIALSGEGYFDPVAFIGTDDNCENRLTLGDCYLSVPKKQSFTLRSFSNVPLRFKLTPPNANIKFTPQLGHLSPGQTKQIELVFTSPAVASDTAKCSVSVQSLQFASDASIASDWDCAQTVSKWISDPAAQPIAEGDDYGNLRRALKKVVEPQPEPEHTITTDVQASKDLFVVYNCDVSTYDIVFPEELDQYGKSIIFRRTKLFQQRSISFTLKNTGKVQLPFQFAVVGQDREPLSDEDASTFTVSPAQGVVNSLQSQEITVVFKPYSVEDKAMLIVGSLPHGPKSDITIPVSGTSECPLVHFELQQSDYLSTRTEGELATVDPASCVVQCFSRGIKIRNTTRFMVLNPTNMSYEFEWDEDVRSSTSISPFRCNTQKGTIHSGKKFEMIFEYTPETLKLREAAWNFKILGHATIPFLFVGQASEPEVYMTQTKINFGQIIVGAKSKQTVMLENRENVPYPFQFDKLPPNSCVTVSPAQGVVAPNSSTQIDVTFTPSVEESYNITLCCRVKRVVAPLTVNVKGEGYTTHDFLRVQAPDGSTQQLSATQANNVNLGMVQVNGKLARKFILTNQGKFNIDYKWIVPANPYVSITPVVGSVAPNTDSVSEFAFVPTKEYALTNFKVQCKITNGNTYTLNLVANASNPNVIMSWTEFDFGPSFVQTLGTAPATTVLSITNKDKSLVAVDSLFDNKEHLETDASSFVIPPGEKRDVRISFAPRDVTMYQETLSFTLNGLTTISAVVRGEGTLPKVDVLTRQVRYGILRVMEKREIEVKIQCKSKIPTPFSLESCLPPELTKLGISTNLDSLVYLKPKETRSIIFTYKPIVRMRPFSHDVKMIVSGQELPFVNVSGSCHGAEVHVDNKTINFGTVVAGTRVTKKVVLLNTGDLNLEFNWNERKLGTDVTIVPLSGSIPAHAEQQCEIVYHPTEANKDAKRDVEVRFDEAPTLLVTLFGASIERPSLTDVIAFNCRVRETVSQRINVKNDSNDQWVVRPVIDNTVWSGPETITVKSKDSSEFIVTYAPQVCTKNRPAATPDLGTVFFPLPNGTALLYKLEGTSEPPSVAAPPIEREVVAKTQHTEKLVVSNWLKVPQRFAVNMTWSHDPNDDSIVIKGVNSIDVPPGATREYKLAFSSLKEGKITGTVHFTNEETKEYQFYNLAFVVKPAKELAPIDLTTLVRTRVLHEITIPNPLAKPVTLTSKCDNADIIVPASVQVPAKSSARIAIEFFPIVAKERVVSRINFLCADLGDFPFVVNATALPPAQEKAIRMQCALGQSVSASLRFLHYCKVATDFNFKFSDPKQVNFSKTNGQLITKVNPCTDLKNGQEVSVDVTFEPSKLGDFKEIVEISSPGGGSYTFPLLATCTPPQRQGPIDIRPNQSVQVAFKNVFNENVPYTFVSDSPNFVVAKGSEVVPGKKPTTIAVQYKCDDPNAVVRGKLTVTGQPASEGQAVQWVYYLRGMKESEVSASSPVPTAAAKKK